MHDSTYTKPSKIPICTFFEKGLSGHMIECKDGCSEREREREREREEGRTADVTILSHYLPAIVWLLIGYNSILVAANIAYYG